MNYPNFLHRGFAAALVLPLLVAACGDSPTGPSVAGPLAPTVVSGDMAALQTTPAGHIRIGVIPSATTIRVGSDADFTVTDKATGATLFAGEGGDVTVDLLSLGGVDTRYWLQTSCSSESSRDDWLARAAALGYETRTEFVPHVPCWRLLLGTEDQGWSARVAFKEAAIEDGLAGSDAFYKLITIVGETELEATFEGEKVVVEAPVVLSSADGLVRIGDRTYRGLAEVWTNSGGALAGINELPLEEYLYGVVPRELPPVPYGLEEAQKAQAVTARTYALANMGKRSSDGYDLLPTTGDQVYGGYQDEDEVSNAAVDATAGQVAVHEGVLISTLYHSTSGGWTANSEDVFVTALPYLRGVPDAERGEALEYVPSVEVFMRNANPINLRAHAEGDFESDWSVYHRWTVTWTKAEMAEILAGSFGASITEVTEVRVKERADQGRVLLIEFDTDAGTFEAGKDAIRWNLRYFDVNGNAASLRSTLFFIAPEVDRRTGETIGWKAYGGGWGHGVGMSQTGAVGMAERGRTYEEILGHYYRGVEIEQRD
ncbi:MAG TPA: SpoIID/LytB domain-containing protein [Longimicrobiales bacterium]|nr:SpoIID/LytB domain-containing protein [Longimicrobiales bacterium]